jgi:multicomponent Na+:H+ antiporter subunit G
MNAWFAAIFLSLGVLFVVVAAVGLLRLPDVYCRSHALGKAFTLGINAMLVGLLFTLGGPAFGLKVILVACFLFLTIPVATHLVCRLAWRNRMPHREGAGWVYPAKEYGRECAPDLEPPSKQELEGPEA